MENKKPTEIADDQSINAIVNEVEELAKENLSHIESERLKKVFYKSKILWLSVALIIVTCSEQLNLISQYVPTEYQNAVNIILGVLIILARATSTKDLTVKPPQS